MLGDQSIFREEPIRDEPDWPRRRTWFLLLGIVGLVLVAACLLPATRRTPTGRRDQCRNNLLQIGLALHNYHAAYAAFPPAFTVNAHGKPLHSWRTLILPYLDQFPLYQTINLSKPWDDPANAKARQTAINTYLCPSEHVEPNTTRYLAVVGPHAFLSPHGSRKLSDITDDQAETIAVIEVDAAHTVEWMSPHDADEALVLGLTDETKFPHEGGGHALFADGSVQFISARTPAAERSALMTIDGKDGPK